ncbi:MULTISPECIES: SMODS domain-containing nucleotidyltransferase [Bifidobacterium]|uniref:Nucleotidyltransferase n=2 Tax=Bifidobacterium TaxID=1678 RepID=A0A6L4WX64_9BIFI|nr:MULTISPECIES: nucleotidyltransferase domain-containing protein [Bifidobacterium]KAB8286698.1 hypothetical protein DSM100688_2193 [Bifidobacterium ramosum]MBT1163565.1 nucleotidyltransferase domain-containing protein [Bifidobacterium felsineum]NEG72776.1 nucleotidyltransferase [Bifidobacterium ramosum]PWG66237.1 nucleotidyltransferase [Bifidobacterium callitrichidarum]
MGVSSTFQGFCSSLLMDEDITDTISLRYHSIVKLINIFYWDISSESLHGLYVGSYGRGTEISTSDIDILVELPPETFHRYNHYASNGQSALLQEVKTVIQTKYSNSHLRGDGQVIVIEWSDGIRFEIVPAFSQDSGNAYYYPDTHNGGSWQVTNPKDEINALNSLSSYYEHSPKDLCRMLRAWRNANNVNISGIAIDALAYDFFLLNDVPIEKYKNYSKYGEMTRDFFAYLVKHGNDSSLFAPGSLSTIDFSVDVTAKANIAYEHAKEAQYDVDLGIDSLAEDEWKSIYGDQFKARLS